ncbi:MAG TPA: hypothetical protein VM032_13400 [Vicinamibacterales bacterium]|nr:hypothetical protein [Vicinamibacterales bacterium]
MCHRPVARAIVLAVVLLALAGGDARAQGYISPFLGLNFGGDATCPQITDCDSRSSNLGLAVGRSNGLFGFEQEFAYAKHFFGPDIVQKGSVLTVMSNFVVGPRLGLVRPYGVLGAGLVKNRIDLTLSDIALGDTSFGWDIGGGLELGGTRAGIRGDVRYFHGFQDVGIPGIGIKDLKLDFGRASLGIVLRF